MLAPNLLRRHFADQVGKHQASHSIPPATPGINLHSPLGRMASLQKKKKTGINKELKTNTQQRGQELTVHRRRGEEKGADLHTNFQLIKTGKERKKDQQQEVDKPLPEVRQVTGHKAHLLSK
jgi:hypothetical protein